MPRLFIGVPVPEEIRTKMDEVRRKVESLGVDCKFVERENLHISLSFLGETPESEIGNISDKLDLIAKSYKKFAVNISSLKLIPSPKYVRVLAFDVADSEKTVRKISSQIKKEIGGDVKPPHLTLARIREKPLENATERLMEMRMDSSFEISSIILFESKLSPKGPKYHVLHESKLDFGV